MTATVEQKRGFYQITTEAGGVAKLTRVTTALDWVLGDGKSAMAYYGGKQFAKWLGDSEAEWMEHYDAWKASDFDPNKTLRRRGKEGTASHALFQGLLERTATCEYDQERELWWIRTGDDPPLVADGFDRGVVEAYINVYHPVLLGGAKVECEKRLYWTEHPIDDCTEHDNQGRCTHGFSGTCDVFFPYCQIDDLKTHVPGYRFSEWMQMAMYSLAAEQMFADELAVIHKQRIVIAHDTPDEETGLYYEVQDDRFLPSSAALPFWELYKMRQAWGPK